MKNLTSSLMMSNKTSIGCVFLVSQQASGVYGIHSLLSHGGLRSFGKNAKIRTTVAKVKKEYVICSNNRVTAEGGRANVHAHYFLGL